MRLSSTLYLSSQIAQNTTAFYILSLYINGLLSSGAVLQGYIAAPANGKLKSLTVNCGFNFATIDMPITGLFRLSLSKTPFPVLNQNTYDPFNQPYDDTVKHQLIAQRYFENLHDMDNMIIDLNNIDLSNPDGLYFRLDMFWPTNPPITGFTVIGYTFVDYEPIKNSIIGYIQPPVNVETKLPGDNLLEKIRSII